MTYHFDGYNYIVRLNKDELLVESLTNLVKQESIKGAWVNGLGGAQWAELGFYNLPEQTYQWQRFDQLMEVTSIQGNIAWDNNEPALHLHGTLSDEKYNAIGGHIKELCVAGTVELHLHTIFGEQLTRQKDEAIGLNLLHL